ncbi:MAG: hypothetical protein KAR62_05200 [Sphingomonadales bacterium]|nr:hypothetical protein [Sphingomonadales bacterium]
MKKLNLFLFPLILAGCAETLTYGAPVSPELETVVAAEGLATPVVTEERMPEAIRLLDYTPLEVFNWLGTPSLVRRDTRVQVAQFANTHCILDVYFYRPSEQMDFLANHVDARTSNGADFSEDECLATLLGGEGFPEELVPSLNDSIGGD